MSKLSDLTSQAVIDLLGNMNYTRAALAIGTVKSGFNTTNAITYTVNGVQYSLAAQTSTALTVTHTDNGNVVGGGYVQPVLTTAYYTLGVNAAGTICVVQGTYLGQAMPLSQAGTSSVGTGAVPTAPDGYTSFGVIKVALAGAATFTPNTTLLDAANVTATYFNIGVFPAGLL
jgi:hypothetical protein